MPLSNRRQTLQRGRDASNEWRASTCAVTLHNHACNARVALPPIISNNEDIDPKMSDVITK